MSVRPAPGPKPLGNIHPGLTQGEVLALKNMAAGNANEGQQKKALEAILVKLCGYYELKSHDDHDVL